jgi:hypothetical protein
VPNRMQIHFTVIMNSCCFNGSPGARHLLGMRESQFLSEKCLVIADKTSVRF